MNIPISGDIGFTDNELGFISYVLAHNNRDFSLEDLVVAHGICMKIEQMTHGDTHIDFLKQLEQDWDKK